MNDYEKLGFTISVPYDRDYSIEAQIKPIKRNSYIVSLFLSDHDSDETWKVEENIRVDGILDINVNGYVAENIRKLINVNHFSSYIDRWEYQKKVFGIGYEKLEGMGCFAL